ncbi:MAG: LysR family transcriptional regulator [Myxococcota bacterium]
MNLDRLEAFVVFSEHLNFTHAARALAVSQPALHAQIARLSEEVGVPLYLRTGRALSLTEEGRRLVGFGRDLLSQIDSFEASLRGEDMSRPVTLAAGEGSLLYLLGAAIRRFTAQRTAPLKLLTVDQVGAVEALRSGQAQVGVASLTQAPADITATPLTAVPAVVLMPADHPLASELGPLPLSALEGASLIVPPAGRPHRQTIALSLYEAGVRWQVSVEASGWELMRRFVSLGLGLSIVNAFCPPPAGCVARPLPDLPARQYWILQRATGRPSPATQQLLSLLLEHAADWRRTGDDGA